MSTNSFLIKGWAITLVAALFALTAKDSNISYTLVAYFATPAFWVLDAYYLSQERKFRALYNYVRCLPNEKVDFDMNTSVPNSTKNGWIASFFSGTEIVFYCTVLITTIIVRGFLK